MTHKGTPNTIGPQAQMGPAQRDPTTHGCSPLGAGVPNCVGVFPALHGCFQQCLAFPVGSLIAGSLWAGPHCVRGPIGFGVPLCVTLKMAKESLRT